MTPKTTRILGAVLCATLVGSASVPAQSKPRKPVSEEDKAKIEASLPDKAPATPKKDRRILLFSRTDGFYHSCIPTGNHALIRMGEKTGAYTADLNDDWSAFEWENLSQYDAVLFNNTTRLKFPTDEALQNLLRFVRSGKGFIGVHAASDNFYDSPEGAEMIGGQFDGHPWGAGGTWAIKLDEPDHPLLASFQEPCFMMNDEIYQIKGPYSRMTHRVLISMDMSQEVNQRGGRKDGDNPISWVKRFGQGRVFYCSFGHNFHLYWNPETLGHYLAGIQYALGDFEVDDRPSALAGAAVGAGVNTYKYWENRHDLGKLESLIRSGEPAAQKAAEQAMIALLQDKDATDDAIDIACRILRQVGTPASVPALAGLLPDERHTHVARLALQGIEGPEADRALLGALSKAGAKQRIGIVETLGSRRQANAVPMLTKALSGNPDLARAALNALGRIGTPEAARALLKPVQSAELEPLRQDALLQCAERLLAGDDGLRIATGLYRQLFEDAEQALIQVAALRGLVMVEGEAVVPRLVAILKGRPGPLRQAALGLINDVQGAGAAKELAKLLSEVDDPTRIVLLGALANLGDPAAEAAVLQQARTASPEVRQAALVALGPLGGTASVKVLTGAIQEDATRAAAMTALAGLRSPPAAQALVAAYREGSPALQKQLAGVFKTRGQRDALPALLQVVQQGDAAAAAEAAKVIGALGGDAEVPALLTMLRADAASAKALGRALAEICNRSEQPGALAGQVAAALNGASAAQTELLLPALARLRDPRAVQAITPLLSASEADVRKATLRALAGWQGAEPVAALLAVVQEPGSPAEGVLAQRAVLQILQRTPDLPAAKKAETLGVLLEAGGAAEKRQVLNGLAQMKDPEVLDVLDRYTDDPDIGADVWKAIARLSSGLNLVGIEGGKGELLAKDATVHGSGASFEAADNRQCIGNWNSTDAWVSWDMYLSEAGTYALAVRQSLDSIPGASYEVELAGQKLKGTVKKTAGWHVFDKVDLGAVKVEKPGRYRVTVKPLTKPASWVMNLRSVELSKQ